MITTDTTQSTTAVPYALRMRDDSLFQLPKPTLMGIINMSPNSFYQPQPSFDAAVQTVADMVKAGADIIDVGGEATSPNVDIAAEAPNLQEELDRVVPIVQAIKQRFDIKVSVDTSQPKVMRESVMSGADMINDQRSLRVEGALATIAELKVPVCLMHFFDKPREPGSSECDALLQEVKRALRLSVQHCLAAGISRQRIIIDPGFGGGNYGKNARENFYLLSRLHKFRDINMPILAGWSRKSMLGEVIGGQPPEARLSASIAAATIAALQGAAIIRVHDVAETMDAFRVVRAFWE